MSGSDEILYVPLMFGYSSYARTGFRAHVLRFGNAPGGDSGVIGSVLGGVGMAVSARSPVRDEAADLAREIGSAATQATTYVRAGGQPGHGAAWVSPQADALVGGFFTATLETMRQSVMRPRVPGHRRFQPLAGELIHRCIWAGLTARDCQAGFDRLVESELEKR